MDRYYRSGDRILIFTFADSDKKDIDPQINKRLGSRTVQFQRAAQSEFASGVGWLFADPVTGGQVRFFQSAGDYNVWRSEALLKLVRDPVSGN